MHLVSKVADSGDRVWNLQREMLKLPQVELMTRHIFVGGMYCRVLPRPAGTLIVGKVHKREHLYVCAKGRVQVTTDDGVQEISAGTVLVCQPGTKRAVLALEDSICLTVHRVDSLTVEEVEAELVEEDKTSPYQVGNTLAPLEIT